MKLNRALASVAAAASLVAAPLAAQAAPTELRTASDVEGENLRGGFLIPLIAVVAVLLGILALTGGDSDAPESP